MNELTQRKIRFSDAARAVGLKTNTLRNWLQRNEIKLFSDHSGPQWAEFTLADIAVLALMRRMVKWGMTVDYANEIALSELSAKSGMLLQYRNTPAAALVAQLSGWHLFIFDGEDDQDPVAAMVPAQDYLPGDKPDFLFINVGSVVKAAFDRLNSDDDVESEA